MVRRVAGGAWPDGLTWSLPTLENRSTWHSGPRWLSVNRSARVSRPRRLSDRRSPEGGDLRSFGWQGRETLSQLGPSPHETEETVLGLFLNLISPDSGEPGTMVGMESVAIVRPASHVCRNLSGAPTRLIARHAIRSYGALRQSALPGSEGQRLCLDQSPLGHIRFSANE